MVPLAESVSVGEVGGDGEQTSKDSVDQDLELRTAAITVAESNLKQRNTMPFTAMPSELVILVFECAARNSKATAASLSLVSHFARATVLPLLFRTLILQRRTTAYALSRFLHEHPHIAAHVRGVWMRESTSSDAALLVPCMRLERLAILPGCLAALCEYGELLSSRLVGGPEEHTSKLTSLCTPHELLISPGCIDWRGFDSGAGEGYTRSFFAGLTHLWLAQASQLLALLECKETSAALSRLTHLAAPLAGLSLKAVAQDVLNTFPALQMFVAAPPTQHDPVLSAWYQRASVRVEPSSVSFLRDPPDERVYLFNAAGQKTEDFLLTHWKEEGDNIWDCIRMNANRDMASQDKTS